MFIQIRKKITIGTKQTIMGLTFTKNIGSLNVACPLRYVLGNRIHMTAVSLFFTRETVLLLLCCFPAHQAYSEKTSTLKGKSFLLKVFFFFFFFFVRAISDLIQVYPFP